MKSNYISIIIGALLVVSYKILELFPTSEKLFFQKAVKPLHGLLASFWDNFSFSGAELLIGAFAVGIIIRIVVGIIRMFQTGNILRQIYSLVLSLAGSFLIVYGGFCLLWGVYYSASEFGDVCELKTNGVEHEDLIYVDRYFVDLANHYSAYVERDENGCASFDEEEIFKHSRTVYRNISEAFPDLESSSYRPKKIYFSEICSLMDFSGFFFPFTAEANINVHAPDSFIPVTIAHELAHQKGIAAEDEANFIGICACIEDGDLNYVYSASLLAVVHLQNALLKSGETQAWQSIRDTYSEGVVADLNQNSEYWAKYRDSYVYKSANNTYDAFLKSYNQELGTQTYGACVDLLVEYYRKK